MSVFMHMICAEGLLFIFVNELFIIIFSSSPITYKPCLWYLKILSIPEG